MTTDPTEATTEVETSNTTAEPTADAVETETPETPTTETTAEPEPVEPPTKAGREAARYRTQLREAEAERDTLRERVTTMQRAEAERIAGATLAKPAALWAGGATLDALLDDAGNLDPKAVADAACAARESLGLPGPEPLVIASPTAAREGANAPDKSFMGAFAPRR